MKTILCLPAENCDVSRLITVEEFEKKSDYKRLSENQQCVASV